MIYMTCLIGDPPLNNAARGGPTSPLLRITCCEYRERAASSGRSMALILPDISATMYWPPLLFIFGKRSLATLGMKPELSTSKEEFLNPVPFPLPANRVRPTTASADG